MGWGYYGGFAPYVPVAQKKAKAERLAAQRAKSAGRDPAPVKIEGRKIARNFWGLAWCQNLEAYSDFANRLPRGRTYVCNGSVVDLEIMPGSIKAIVAGSEPYDITIEISQLAAAQWKAIKKECAGQIGSLVELLQGKLSKSVLEIVTRKETGLFPSPKEIKKSCSCPDYAGLCKHLAAVLYAVGARLDARPELLFKLRKVDHLELIEGAGTASLATTKSTRTKTIATAELADMFGIEMAEAKSTAAPTIKPAPKARKPRAAKAPVIPEPVVATQPKGVKRTKPAAKPKRARSTSSKAVARLVHAMAKSGNVSMAAIEAAIDEAENKSKATAPKKKSTRPKATAKARSK